MSLLLVMMTMTVMIYFQFKILLDYMYNKPISVPSSQVVDLLSLANRYQVRVLSVLALRFFMCPVVVVIAVLVDVTAYCTLLYCLRLPSVLNCTLLYCLRPPTGLYHTACAAYSQWTTLYCNILCPVLYYPRVLDWAAYWS